MDSFCVTEQCRTYLYKVQQTIKKRRINLPEEIFFTGSDKHSTSFNFKVLIMTPCSLLGGLLRHSMSSNVISRPHILPCWIIYSEEASIFWFMQWIQSRLCVQYTDNSLLQSCFRKTGIKKLTVLSVISITLQRWPPLVQQCSKFSYGGWRLFAAHWARKKECMSGVWSLVCILAAFCCCFI